MNKPLNELPTARDEQAVASTPLVDFHAHFLPRAYVERGLTAQPEPHACGPRPDWNFDGHLSFMHEAGIEISVLSIASPGFHRSGQSTPTELVTLGNDEAAALAQREPTRIRFLASLPLPDVDAAIAEWRRVRDAPGCAGAIVPSNALGLYPGDSRFDPLWHELDRCRALVLVHPTSPPSRSVRVRDATNSIMERYFETARACLSLFESNVVTRYADIRFLMPHCGGTLPIVIDRILMFGLAGLTVAPALTKSQLQCLWFDVAGTPFPTQLPALLAHAAEDRIVYGSEYWDTPQVTIVEQLALLSAKVSPSSNASLRAVLAANGRALLNSQHADCLPRKSTRGS